MKRRKFFVIAGIVLVLAVLAFIAMALLRRPADKPVVTPVFVERPTPAADPTVAALLGNPGLILASNLCYAR